MKPIKAPAIIALCLSFLLLILVSCGQPANRPPTAEELLNLGEKHLLALNYEQAAIAFEQLIAIEPQNPRGYIGAAEAYGGLGDTDKAIDMLRKGAVALPDNRDIANMLESMLNPLSDMAADTETTPGNESIEQTPPPSPEPNEFSQTDTAVFTGPLLRDELTINGIRLGTGTIHEFAASFGSEIIESSNSDFEGYEGMSVYGSVITDAFGENPNDTWINQAHGSNRVGYLQVFRKGVIGPRGVTIGVTTRAEAIQLLNEEFLSYDFDDENGKVTFYIKRT